jgi:hypothetical protein
MTIITAKIDASPRRGIVENPLVGAACHLNAVERACDAEDVFERAIHRTAAGSARSNERSIDVEENNRHSA